MNAPPADKPDVTTSSQLLKQGHYARKQIFSRNAIVSWSHRRRFALARELASAGAGGALLGYGCGDGAFIALARQLFREATGTDVDVEKMRDCKKRAVALRGVWFGFSYPLPRSTHGGPPAAR